MRDIAGKLNVIKNQRLAVKNALISKSIASESDSYSQLARRIEEFKVEQYAGIDTRQKEPVITIIKQYLGNSFIGVNKKLFNEDKSFTKVGITLKSPLTTTLTVNLLKNNQIAESLVVEIGLITKLKDISLGFSTGDSLSTNVVGNPNQDIGLIFS